MKEAKHPVGPAFDHAREKEEAWRQQQIAALTQNQAREYAHRVKDEQKKLETEKQRIEAEKPRQIEAEKQKLLSGKPAPDLRMIQGDAMKNKKAGELAKAKVAQQSKTEIERANKESKDRQDGYLRQTERERVENKKQEQTASRDLKEKAQNQEKNRNKDALARAFEKAERQQQQSQERTLAQATQEKTEDQARNREQGRN